MQYLQRNEVGRLIVSCVIFFLVSGFSLAQSINADYQVFPKGEAQTISYDKLLKKLKKADVILFGENHQNKDCHDFELKLEEDLFKAMHQKLIIGAEMFESDDQLVLEEYLQGLILEKHLKSEAKMWANYDRDYAPLLHFAKVHKIPFIGTNIPQRYANLVARKGLNHLDSISAKGLKYICPLPMEVDMDLPGYQYLMTAMAGHGGSGMDHPENIVHAQAIKDATMAHFIINNYQKGDLFLHLNGSFHSDNFEGIYYYLKQYRSKLNVITISTTVQDETESILEENQNLADYILVVK